MALSMAGVGGMIGARPLEARVARRANGNRTWGVQLYTVRDLLAASPERTINALVEMGYKEAEVIQPTLDVVAPLARKAGLGLVSIHLDGPTAKGEGMAPLVARAKDLGIRYIVIPYVPPNERPTTGAGFEELAMHCNRMADIVKRAGLELCYHNHAFEFGKDTDGRQWLDVLMDKTTPSGMGLELDVFWASVAGADPLEVMRRYPGRTVLMHLKDKAKGTSATLVESAVPRNAFVELGAGALDVPAILNAAASNNVAHCFVEQDFTPGDPLASLRQSLAYLVAKAGRS
jgi:sugar phosphate isomerase/epimerase